MVWYWVVVELFIGDYDLVIKYFIEVLDIFFGELVFKFVLVVIVELVGNIDEYKFY